MNNRLFDTNIGSLDFQPMPKHFMVWDKERKQFWTLGDLMPGPAEPAASETRFNMSDMIELSKQFKNTPLTPTRSIICQSTNQFDKDRKEIFEGSIVYCESDDEYGSYKSTGATITTSGPDVYLETHGLDNDMCIEINYCPICGRKLKGKD